MAFDTADGEDTSKRHAGYVALFACAITCGMPLYATQAKNGDWPMAARDYANTRYSPLDQINASNVKDLKPAFTFSTGLVRGNEAAPRQRQDCLGAATAQVRTRMC